MSTPIVFTRSSDEPVHIPVSDLDASWRADAVLRAYPGGPELHRWESSTGTAAVENGEVVLLAPPGDVSWTSGDLWITLTGPEGSIVRGPIRVRLWG